MANLHGSEADVRLHSRQPSRQRGEGAILGRDQGLDMSQGREIPPRQLFQGELAGELLGGVPVGDLVRQLARTVMCFLVPIGQSGLH